MYMLQNVLSILIAIFLTIGFYILINNRNCIIIS